MTNRSAQEEPLTALDHDAELVLEMVRLSEHDAQTYSDR